jgi:serine/threonine-protein phosphatase PP1 catalytic subunit
MGFLDEVVKKYDVDLYDAFLSYFNTLPVAAVIENQVFVVHGGISRESSNITIEQLNSLDRHCEPVLMPLALYELLWAGKLAVLME